MWSFLNTPIIALLWSRIGYEKASAMRIALKTNGQHLKTSWLLKTFFFVTCRYCKFSRTSRHLTISTTSRTPEFTKTISTYIFNSHISSSHGTKIRIIRPLSLFRHRLPQTKHTVNWPSWIKILKQLVCVWLLRTARTRHFQRIKQLKNVAL